MTDLAFPITRKKLLAVALFAGCMLATGNAWAQLKPGIVVEKVEKNSAGEQAGLQEGDILLRWSRGDIKNEIASPFDISTIEIEQAPQGKIALEGLRGAEKRIWTLGPLAWGLVVRPNFVESLLVSYRDGQELASAAKLNEAAARWHAAEVEAQKLSSSWLPAWLSFYAGQQLAAARQWSEADNAYQRALQQAVGSEAATTVQILRAWAVSYERRGDLAGAAKLQDLAQADSKRSGAETLFTALSLDNSGNLASQLGDYVKAEECYQHALTIRQSLAPGSLTVASSFGNLGQFGIAQGNLAKAEGYLGQALVLREKLAPGSLEVAGTFNLLGLVAYYHGDLAKSEELFHQALELQEKLAPGSLGLASTLGNLGNTYVDQGELAKAEQCQRQALEIREGLAPGGILVAKSWNNLGVIAWTRGDLARAEDYFERSLSLKRKLAPDSFDVANALNNLGAVADERGDLGKAENYYRQALTITERLAPGGMDDAETLVSLGELAKKQRYVRKAQEYFHQALTIEQKQAPYGPLTALIVERLAEVSQDEGDLAKAEKGYRQALAIREKVVPGSADHAESLAALAGIARNKQHTPDAMQLYEQALSAFESQTGRMGGKEETRSGFRAKHASYYIDYIDLLVAEKQPERAFQVLERLRARSLVETLSGARIDIRKDVDSSLLERERALQKLLNAKSNHRTQLLGDKHTEEEIAALDKEINELLGKCNDVEEQIRASSPAYAALTQPQPLSAKEVQQQLLDTGTLLLEYSLGEERSYVFAITPNSINAYPLPKRSEVESTARSLYDLLTSRGKSQSGSATGKNQVSTAGTEYSEAADELSRMILRPVAAEIQNKRLVIVSDGALQYIPFAALPIPGKQAPLLAEHEVVSLPSASVLAVLRHEEASRKQPSKAVAVLADPVFAVKDDRIRLASDKKSAGDSLSRQLAATPAISHAADTLLEGGPSDLDRSAREIGIAADGMFPRLPFTRREADAISSITNRNDALEALDFDASKATALSSQLKDYRIIHFATHGLLNNDHPELSGLVFSLVDKQGNSQDGFLRLLDIYNMDLNADLVVLSACQTALGKEIGEEGLIGLTRGFMYAGAPRVVASLWKVDDEATAALMKTFYEGMLRDHQTPAQALRAAQQWMRTQKAWQSPYYWAGFILQGEWK